MEFMLTVIEVAMMLGFSIGYLWGAAFSGFDGQVKYGSSSNYGNWSSWKKFLVGALLDATHHFQFGLALILWVMLNLNPSSIKYLLLLNIGWGLVISDWKDYKNVLKRIGL